MTLAALLDLGVPEEAVRIELEKLPVKGVRLERSRVMRGALSGAKIHVHIDAPSGTGRGHHHDHPHHDHDAHAHTHYREIRAMLQSSLAGDVLQRTLAMFDRIADVEAKLHGVAVGDVQFHEVGAIDSIVDIVGTAAALAWLAPAKIISRRVPLGGGSVKTAHGILPVPAPATLALLIGAEVEAGGDTELTTPTGAAIIAANSDSFGPMPPMSVLSVGWGAGDHELPDRPNLLRIVVGDATVATPRDELLWVIESNVDDMNPQLAEPVLEALLAAGAVDAWLQPIAMKKGRPALQISALASESAKSEVVAALLRETTSIGVRFHAVSREILERRFVEVDTPYGRVPIKVAGRGAEELNAAPEFEVCRRLAEEKRVPVKRVLNAALAAYFRAHSG